MDKKILILNSNLDDLASWRSLLAKEGCEVITANSMDTAKKLMESIKIDYVVLDSKSFLMNEPKISRDALK